jgi:hypothetical protein
VANIGFSGFILKKGARDGGRKNRDGYRKRDGDEDWAFLKALILSQDKS